MGAEQLYGHGQSELFNLHFTDIDTFSFLSPHKKACVELPLNSPSLADCSRLLFFHFARSAHSMPRTLYSLHNVCLTSAISLHQG